MNPPYEITRSILERVTSISEKMGEIKASYLLKTSPTLRKQNRIKTIHSSLKIEGNTLSEDQITAIIENKRVLGPEKDIHEVKNAIEVYSQLPSFNANSQKSFRYAHKLLKQGLVSNPGKYRTGGVGIMRGSKVEHVAPPAKNVSRLMNDLFNYLSANNDLTLIKSCVFHYEMEFIHPFSDGNGRMGRLWQTVILMADYSVFQYLPFETLIAETQEDYYKSLSQSDKAGSSTLFIEYMLTVIDRTLKKWVDRKGHTLNQQDRLDHFVSLNVKSFSRKEYMAVFRNISSATASRDLKQGLEIGLFEITGSGNATVYHLRGGIHGQRL